MNESMKSKLELIKKSVKSELQLNSLSETSIKRINNLVIELIAEDYIKMVKTDRTNRLKLVDQINQYVVYVL